MTYDEATLFMKFMQGKGVLNNFEYLYRSHRFDKKKDLERYMDEVDAEDVILSAFDFTGAGNTIFGFKYWKEIDQKWQAKLKEFRETGSHDVEDEVEIYCPHCQRVLPRSAFSTKSNGVLHKHCKECEGGIWDKQKKEREKAEKEAEKQIKAMAQLEKEIAEKQAKLERLAIQGPEPELSGKILKNNRCETARQQIAEGQANLDKTTKVCGHCGKRKLISEFDSSDTTEDGLQSWCRKCQTAASNVSTQVDLQHERQKMLEKEKTYMVVKADDVTNPQQPTVAKAVEPTVVDKSKSIRPDKLVAPKLGEYDATLHYKQNQKSLTLNAVLSKQIREGEFTKCYLNTDRQHRQFLIFNRVEGSNVTGASSIAQSLLNVTSADIARALAARFNLELGDNYYLQITRNLARINNVLTVEVIAARSREEYVKIAERRELAAKGKIPPYEAEEETPVTTAADESLQNEDNTVSRDNDTATTLCNDVTPVLDFGPTVTADSKPDEILDYLIDLGHLTERDLAIYLHQKGWELQEPVIVKKMKKFTV